MKPNHQERFTVRDYECDIQGIVNNAVYLNYLEHARHRFLKSYGIDFTEMSRQGLDLVVSEMHLKYLKSLKHDDEFCVETSFAKASKIRFVFRQSIYLSDTSKTPILEAEVIGCCVDRKRARPIQIENSILDAL